MLDTQCPHCGVHSYLAYCWSDCTTEDELHGPHIIDAAYRCSRCKKILSTRVTYLRPQMPIQSEHQSVIEEADRFSLLEWKPPRLDFEPPNGVPEGISAASVEAHRSLAVGNHMAAVLMARSVMEAAAKDCGVTEGNLFAKINTMRTRELLTQDVAEIAHVIRDSGNTMAHGDFVDAIVADRAKPVAGPLLELMDSVLKSLYSDKAKLEWIQSQLNE